MPTYTMPVFDNGTVLVNGVPTTDFTLQYPNGTTILFPERSTVKLRITDNDNRLSNDNNVNEQSDDTTQQTTNILGTTEKVYVDYAYTLQDSSGNSYTIYVIDVRNSPDSTIANNQAVTYIGFDPNNKPPLGVPLRITAFTGGTSTVPYSTLVCFTTGTLVATPGGERAIETLRPGDRVTTRDGEAVLRWVGRRSISAFELMRHRPYRPVVVRQGALGPGRPARDTAFSPQHRILIEGTSVEMMFGTRAALAPVKGLMDAVSVVPADHGSGVTYVHLLFDRHEVIRANGLWAESLLIARVSGRALGLEGEDGGEPVMAGAAETGIVHDRAAAPLLRAFEARLWMRARAGLRPRRVA